MQPVVDYVKIIGLQYEELYQHLDAEDIEASAETLRSRLVHSYATNQKQQLAKQIAITTDDHELHELMRAVDSFNQLIK